ncbi:MAG: glycoside hydrolase family 97 catalytic domain-containing protein [Saprospiraceae bacterium]|nr:glycoside hydrolase family 97 catalytic domain-containing protein [Saprospiraceae bacterium]
MKFVKDDSQSHSLGISMDGKVDLRAADHRTPWRYVMVGESPGQLLENNYFLLNLSDPVQIADPSWIRPGKVIREVTLTTDGGLACVDFASRLGLQFVEFDAGWYGPENDPNSDATTITVDPRRSAGPLDLHRVIEYASSKDIGIILYVNHLALEKQLDTLLPLYRSWGVKGLKFGFVNVGEQNWTAWMHEAVRKAAQFQLMVDVHDEYRPTGYSRTYPNLMTQEGIRGDEESPSVEYTLNTLFTRMIAGAGDYTNCYFAPRVTEKMGGEAGQMAKSIMLYSPWQFLFWYDRPDSSPHKEGGAGSSQGIIRETEALEFYRHLPTTWDATKVFDGEIGTYATIARKSGNDWFVGSLAANEGRLLRLPLTFLDKDRPYEATLYYQDADSRVQRKVLIEKFKVNHKSVIEQELLAESGVAIVLRSK